MAIYSQSQLYQLAVSVGLSSQNALTASAIAMAESSGNSAAINPGNSSDHEYSVGLWQINILAHPQYTAAQMLDPTQNAKAMAIISNSGNSWTPWGTFTRGDYRRFMNSSITTTPVLPSGYVPSGNPTGLLDLTTGFTGNVKTNPATTSDIGSAWTYVLAYLVATVILVFVSRFQAGYNALYYLAVLFLMLLILTQATFIANALKPISQPDLGPTTTTVFL